MAWVLLIIAGLFEMLGVSSIHAVRERVTVRSVAQFVGSFGMSFLLLGLAMKTLPMGVAYAVWTGIGASGGAILGIIRFGESREAIRLFFIGLIIAAAVGLKLVAG
ncbi:QacE family quaternary ammonium compound efflux SMR transporter [Planococcaceae bacterium Storch 2/2-2]|nr:QacE family quaternary ammonium compound efflux SMR transporter [Planococcaceae bacterium Storch 2/2-2]